MAALNWVRKEQVAAMKWEEIDEEHWVWKCEEHKARKEKLDRDGNTVLDGTAHVVPFADASIEILKYMREYQKAAGINSKFTFVSNRGRTSKSGHVDKTTINTWLKGGFFKRHPQYRDKLTPHGFRTTGKSWARENGWPEIDSEMALAHRLGDRVQEIYARDAERIEQRRDMMQAYADYCSRTAPLPANVHRIRRRPKRRRTS
jgi:integrase